MRNRGLEITTLILIVLGFALIFFSIDSRIRSVEKLIRQVDTVKIVEKHYNNTDTTIVKYFNSSSDTLIFRENNYYKSDSLVKIKYLDGQVVFPVTTFVLIGYDIDSFKASCLMGLRDQIDSVFNLKY